MAYRSFADASGLGWEVWTVLPSPSGTWPGGRRLANATRGHAAPQAPAIHAAMRHGWLAFQADGQHRRFMGIPDGWESEPDAGLVQLLGQAERVERRARVRE